MNKLESKILDNVNKQKKEGSYLKPQKRNYSSDLLKEAMKQSGINIEFVDVKTQD